MHTSKPSGEIDEYFLDSGSGNDTDNNGEAGGSGSHAAGNGNITSGASPYTFEGDAKADDNIDIDIDCWIKYPQSPLHSKSFEYGYNVATKIFSENEVRPQGITGTGSPLLVVISRSFVLLLMYSSSLVLQKSASSSPRS